MCLFVPITHTEKNAVESSDIISLGLESSKKNEDDDDPSHHGNRIAPQSAHAQ